MPKKLLVQELWQIQPFKKIQSISKRLLIMHHVTRNDFVCVELSGGLGNQLFQYAFGYEKAKRTKKPLLIDCSIPTADNAFRKLELLAFDLPGIFFNSKKIYHDNAVILSGVKLIRNSYKNFNIAQFPIELNFYREEDFNFDPFLMDLESGYYSGYFQSHKYCKSSIEDLRKFLNISFFDQNSICLHVRRGDYLNNLDYHGICDNSYYQNAISNYAAENQSFNIKIFSDDIEWCKDHLHFENITIEYDKSVEAKDVLFSMASCGAFIIANSSLSWWASQLSPNQAKKIYAPDPWFGHRIDTPDLYPSNWIRLNRINGLSSQMISDLSINRKISVVMPIHRRIRYLHDALTSVFHQTYPVFEIILSLNGSDTKTTDYIYENFSNHPAIKIITSEKGNLSHGRNNGIKIAQGDFIAILDDDDIWHERKLERQIDWMVKFDLGAVASDYLLFDEDGTIPNSGFEKIYGPDELKEKIVLDNFLSGGSAALIERNALFRAGLFDETLPSCEDHDMWRRLAKIVKLGIVPEQLVKVRRSPESMSAQKDLMKIGMLLHSQKKIVNAYDRSILRKNIYLVRKNLLLWIGIKKIRSGLIVVQKFYQDFLGKNRRSINVEQIDRLIRKMQLRKLSFIEKLRLYFAFDCVINQED